MSGQMTFAEEPSLSRRRKQTKRERFLAEMDAVVPWARLVALIEPHYPKGGSGRKPMPLERMLRIHFLQQWFGYSDPGMEEALYEIPLLRRFVGIDLGRDFVPDETTILKFRRLLERHALAQAIFAEVQSVLQEKGLLLQEGKTVDATLIHAPSSTKNRDRQRDPEMSSTKKGNQWYFGMKAHVATDLQGIVQAVDFTAAKVPDHQMLDGLLTGEESVVLADRGIKNAVARRRYPGQKTGLAALKRYNRAIARIRARGEHIFRVLKCQFGSDQLRPAEPSMR
ncbi:MAG: IS5 family transposase [Acidithiobacillus caldus]|uniref:ISMca7, transposase n=5 Tax=Acidithiobacillus caldus TaxID=33059 RepID=F9ZPN2_ACICS|nr:IS5 family transposase [Acidithiobacillus caldus]AEK56782.1 ISMca7, transposase [Acidithiobacillus caldus SM-1]AIA54091.1 transposase-like protein TnpA3 [Acidithiobacillus caldus ATCC 51756]MBU2802563.1 IS5 family transposase [Acidithiobacillus caldus]WMT46191.1 MAG: IS5 family transposase [Acidithiobacillus caldus]